MLFTGTLPLNDKTFLSSDLLCTFDRDCKELGPNCPSWLLKAIKITKEYTCTCNWFRTHFHSSTDKLIDDVFYLQKK